ncbi:MAG: GrlR family regulatory protein [Candidatus Caenarcaniphilales bacterium]|nr:GrlR family regulatory protein [Candidatus Caenarcaniphilales bacterium]
MINENETLNIDAIWSSDFYYFLGFGGKGILVFSSGQAFGGDSHHTYSGKYEFLNEFLYVTIKVLQYTQEPISELAKYKEHTIVLKGKPNNYEFEMFGYLEGLPDPVMKTTLVRRAELK